MFAGRPRVIDESWLQIVPVATAVLAYGFADGLGGSGFIAAFVGGGVFGALRRRQGGEVGYLVEELGGVLSSVTFVVFGAIMLGPALGATTWQIVALCRPQPHGRAHAPGRDRAARHRARRPTVGFVGWFGPRGLASIVFAVIIVEEGGLPHEDVVITTTVLTVALSILAHGLTAAPLADRYADWFASHPKDSLPALESSAPTHVPWRNPRIPARPVEPH